jgi:hypothetical protein
VQQVAAASEASIKDVEPAAEMSGKRAGDFVAACGNED